MNKAFTLIELLVTVVIIVILSSIILLTVAHYVNSGKDANIQANLNVLIPAGEAYYNIGNTYAGFCASNVTINAFSQMPSETNRYCIVNNAGDAWAACAKEFVGLNKAYCVDSRGIKKETAGGYDDCKSYINTNFKCL